MKKNIGTNLALYPTPLVVVGTMVDGKPNYTLVGHLGIIGHDRIMISLANTHYSNQVIKVSYLRKAQIVKMILPSLPNRVNKTLHPYLMKQQQNH